MPLKKSEFSNRYVEVITAQTTAFTSQAYEINAEGEYTLSCSTLDVSEEITIEIYDHTQNKWQPLMIDGRLFRLIKDYENIPMPKMACVVRFIKTVTGQAVGLTLAYKGSRYVNIKPISEV